MRVCLASLKLVEAWKLRNRSLNFEHQHRIRQLFIFEALMLASFTGGREIKKNPFCFIIPLPPTKFPCFTRGCCVPQCAAKKMFFALAVHNTPLFHTVCRLAADSAAALALASYHGYTRKRALGSPWWECGMHHDQDAASRLLLFDFLAALRSLFPSLFSSQDSFERSFTSTRQQRRGKYTVGWSVIVQSLWMSYDHRGCRSQTVGLRPSPFAGRMGREMGSE